MVRLICHNKTEEVEHVFIKMTIFASVALPLLKEMLPRARGLIQ